MYVTRPLSLYRNSPSSLSSAPPEGPNSGILVIQDEEPAETRWCCGLFKTKESVKELPFPQNKILRLTHAADAGEIEYSESVRAVLIPVLNLPLSSNQYYIINSHSNSKRASMHKFKGRRNKRPLLLQRSGSAATTFRPKKCISAIPNQRLHILWRTQRLHHQVHGTGRGSSKTPKPQGLESIHPTPQKLRTH